MNNTIRIARIISIYFLVTGLGFLISEEYFSKMITHTGSDPVLINLSGMVHFFIGMTILVNHFRWHGLLEIIVTVFGIMFFLKGTFLIVLPELTLQTGNNPVQNTWIMSAVFISTGLLVAYLAYVKRSSVNEVVREK